MVTGGDEASLAIDTHLGLDEHVHLHFCGTHPMEFRAREEGRILTTRYIKVSPNVLLRDGVLLSDQVSTANAANIRPANELVPKMDFEVTYTRTDWRIPEIQARRRAAEKWEALIPGAIGLGDIVAL